MKLNIEPHGFLNTNNVSDLLVDTGTVVSNGDTYCFRFLRRIQDVSSTDVVEAQGMEKAVLNQYPANIQS